MEFIYPTFLWALLVLAIPVIIHLFYFRKFKRVMFPNVNFLQELKEETSTRNKIKNLLILFSRLLALTALVFAFAQPYIPQGTDIKKGNSAISIFIDNSFSMNAEKEGIPLFHIAKEKARQVIDAYSEEDRFQILTHDFEAQHQRLVSKEDAYALIDNIDPTPKVNTLTKVLSRQKQVVFGQEENEISYIISDFQETTNDLKSYSDSTLELNLIPLQSVQENNVSLDSVWLDSPVPLINQNNKLVVKISNHSDSKAEGIRLSIKKDGQEKPEGVYDIEPQKSIIDTINITILKPGWHKAEVKISDYPVQFDDIYYIAFNVAEKINVLSLNQSKANRYLTALYRGLDIYKLTNQNESNVDYGSLSNYDLIITNDLQSLSSGLASELTSYMNNGGNVLMFPAINGNISSYNSFLSGIGANTIIELTNESKQVNEINTDEFVFNEVYKYKQSNIKLPTTTNNYKINRFQNIDSESLLSYRDGDEYLVKYRKGKGNLYLCSSGLSEDLNDLVLNAEVFVPMLYKMAIASNEHQKISYTLGQDEVIETEQNTSSNQIVYSISGKSDFIPGKTNYGTRVLLSINDQIKESGYNQLNLGDDMLAELAFNYDRTESNLALSGIESLKNLAKSEYVNLYDHSKTVDLSTHIGEKDKGITLWKWSIILALIFLAIETILIRYLPK